MDKVTEKLITIDSDIRNLLSKIRGTVGHQIYLGNGKAWRIDKNVLKTSKSVNRENLKEAVELYFRGCDNKLDFLVWRVGLESETLVYMANDIIDKNIESLTEELNKYMKCIEIIMPESIIEVSSEGKSERYIKL